LLKQDAVAFKHAPKTNAMAAGEVLFENTTPKQTQQKKRLESQILGLLVN
jgi:hypothetical protein